MLPLEHTVEYGPFNRLAHRVVIGTALLTRLVLDRDRVQHVLSVLDRVSFHGAAWTSASWSPWHQLAPGPGQLMDLGPAAIKDKEKIMKAIAYPRGGHADSRMSRI